MHYDVFNGDADGIIALHQLRLADPRPDATLVTGVKRDIALLGRIADANNAAITALDISLDRNREPLRHLLDQGCTVFYADHHFAGEIPESPLLTVHIDPDPEICTALIVDRLLEGRFRTWAVAAAFGDNLHDTARRVAGTIGLTDEAISCLREIGELLNYNGYGFDPQDLLLHPAALYKAVSPYRDPFEFFRHADVLQQLRQGFAADSKKAESMSPYRESSGGRVYLLPAESWSRRIVGIFSNERAREKPNQANAVLIANQDGSYRVSVRAPLADKKNADTLCRAFPSGGGRAAAAGINALPADRLENFLAAFQETFAAKIQSLPS